MFKVHPKRFCAALAVASVPWAALAQPVAMPTEVADVLSLEVGARLEHHSNLFRQPEAMSDTALHGFLGGRFERQFSLQRVAAYASIEPVKYFSNADFDYLGYAVGGQWDFEVGRPVFGTITTRLSQLQTPFETVGEESNLQDALLVRGLMGVRLTQSWAVIAAADYLKQNNSATAQEAADFNRNGFEAGLRYAPYRAADFDFVFRREEGTYPNRQVFDANGNLLGIGIDNVYTQDAALLRIAYRPSEVSRVDGNIGVTRRAYDNVSERDFSGLTTNLEVTWPLTGATTMRAAVYRAIDTTELLSASYITATGTALRPSWTVTGRITLEGLLSYAQQSYDGDPGFALTGQEVRKDDLLGLGVRVNYEVARRVFVVGELNRLNRDSNYAEFDFTDTWLALGVRSTF